MYPESLSWAHGVNAEPALVSALADATIDALEFDVSYNVHHDVPVLRHASSSTLEKIEDEFTMKRFLDVYAASEDADRIRVLKFDFKSLAAVQKTLDLLREVGLEDVELWFNADVVVGPGTPRGNDKIVDPHSFLPACASAYPRSTLSLGWTTDFSFLTTYRYEVEHLAEMLDVVNLHSDVLEKNTLTFALRASLVHPSLDALHETLLREDRYVIEDHGRTKFLTVWTGVEGVPEEELRIFRQNTPEEVRIEFDVDKGSKKSWFHATRLYSYPKDAVEYLLST